MEREARRRAERRNVQQLIGAIRAVGAVLAHLVGEVRGAILAHVVGEVRGAMLAAVVGEVLGAILADGVLVHLVRLFVVRVLVEGGLVVLAFAAALLAMRGVGLLDAHVALGLVRAILPLPGVWARRARRARGGRRGRGR